MKLETVKIDDGNGDYILINKKDYDKDKHKLYGVEEKPKKKQKKAKELDKSED